LNFSMGMKLLMAIRSSTTAPAVKAW
jgi:hypothetical protein